MKRAYELMTIFDRDVEESTIDGLLNTVDQQIAAAGGQVMSTDKWGLRKFAYPIDHKDDGYYVVNEIATEARDLGETDRYLGLADEVVRHKIVRLPDDEADRRGLFTGEPRGVVKSTAPDALDSGPAPTETDADVESASDGADEAPAAASGDGAAEGDDREGADEAAETN